MKTLIQIFTIAALPFWLGGCGGSDGHDHSHGGLGHESHGAHSEEEAPMEVTLSEAAIKQHQIEPLGTVKGHTLQPTFSVPARVVFNEETTTHVGTLVKGRVSDMKVHLGDTVKKGEILFTIESPELGQAQNAFLAALDAEAAAGPAVVLAQNNAVVAQAQAEGKSAEAMVALAENPAAEVEALGKLDAAKPALERAKDLLKSGQELSAGQWQRVALARAFMRSEANILVLDEPTASMDSEAEAEIFDHFRSLTKEKIAVLISHRFSTVRRADLIVVMERGRIVERGSHDELVASQGRYAKLFEFQARGYR